MDDLPDAATQVHRTGHAVMLGDLVHSRRTGGRALRQLSEVLVQVDKRVPATQQPAVTIGDEFQAVYATVGEAAHAALVCRLLLAERGIDSRYSVAWGRIPHWSIGREPYGQDGPAWWAARDALTELAAMNKRRRSAPQVRTIVRVDPDVAVFDTVADAQALIPPPRGQLSMPLTRAGLPRGFYLSVEPLLQALMHARDTLIDRWDTRDRQLYLGLEDGASLPTVAGRIGVSVAAASVRCQRNGIYTLLHMEQYVRTAFKRNAGEGG